MHSAHVAEFLPANVDEVATRNGGRELESLVVVVFNALVGQALIYAIELHRAVGGAGSNGFLNPHYPAVLHVIVGHLGRSPWGDHRN